MISVRVRVLVALLLFVIDEVNPFIELGMLPAFGRPAIVVPVPVTLPLAGAGVTTLSLAQATLADSLVGTTVDRASLPQQKSARLVEDWDLLLLPLPVFLAPFVDAMLMSSVVFVSGSYPLSRFPLTANAVANPPLLIAPGTWALMCWQLDELEVLAELDRPYMPLLNRLTIVSSIGAFLGRPAIASSALLPRLPMQECRLSSGSVQLHGSSGGLQQLCRTRCDRLTFTYVFMFRLVVSSRTTAVST